MTRSAGGDRQAQLRTIGEVMPRLVRLIHAYKTATTGQSRDRAAHVLLFPLVRLGPLRQSALADLVHADPSTISRHVAMLVEHGLVRRIADETDGRASRLVVTDAGHATLAQLRAEREGHLAQITADWDDADLATFTALFGRLVDGMAALLPDDAALADDPPLPDDAVPSDPEEAR
ncbi:MarR family winged helix-turn-helix transcriptional regulator [Trujillonella endophytica]|uniref:DNA-binding transcriptional regulator, MarR family n=1 Tax=Trujillonella endophytica TaxID=673521 RepID=A0A1H8WHA1_9ACTN|nr:MarR family transcriptional regulator [Trujillella endophytica]SEP26817.1 DNA-binding transcriptional regulator, MarR family [Trujillella endophytica]